MQGTVDWSTSDLHVFIACTVNVQVIESVTECIEKQKQ